MDPILVWALRSTLPPVPLQPFAPITTRNLIYHCYAHPDSFAWIENLAELRKRLHLFNGRRIVVVVKAHDLIGIDQVQAILGEEIEYHLVPNDLRLRDAASFLLLLKQVRSINTYEATFYAHTKGTAPHHRGNAAKLLAILYWRNRMYHELLDHWPQVAAKLKQYACVGTHKIDYSLIKDHVMQSPTGLQWGKWHFAGNFYWFRHDCIFRNPHWSEIPDDPYAAEMWLGKFIDTADAVSMFQSWNPLTNPAPDLYNPESHLGLNNP